MQSAQPDPATLIADLRKRWTKLKDVDRALGVRKVHLAGVSLRTLAKELSRSPTLMRKLNQAAQAPTPDLIRARTGNISTRELARRSKAAEVHREVEEREAEEHKRMQAAQQGCQAICDWLEEEKLWPSHGEVIVDEARMILFGAERYGTLPQEPPPPPGTPVEEIIRRRRPKPETVETFDVARYAEWLAIWAYYAFPDTVVRDRALNLALDRQIRG